MVVESGDLEKDEEEGLAIGSSLVTEEVLAANEELVFEMEDVWFAMRDTPV